MKRAERMPADASRARQVGAALFNLRPGDGLPLVILLGHSFLKGAAHVLLETPANSLFLTRFSIDKLPLIYICTALVCTAIGLLYTRLEVRLSVQTLLTATLGFVAAATLAFYLALVTVNSEPVIFGVMVWKDVHWTLMNLEFWALAGLMLDVRQGKRLFGLIALGEIVASIAGGFSVPLFINAGGILTLLLTSGVLTVGNVFLLFYTMRHLRRRDQALEAEKISDRKPWWILFRDRYLGLFFGVSVLSIFSEYFIDYLFYEKVERAFASEEKLAAFFGMFYGVLGVGQLVSSAWVSGRGLTRYGLSFGLLVLPLAALLTTGIASTTVLLGAAGAALFWSVVAAKFFDEVGRHTIEMPAYRILYQPLAPDMRLRVQAVRESMVEPLALGLVGAILWAGAAILDVRPTRILYLAVVVVLGWIVLGVLLRREYTIRLTRALTTRRLGHAAGLALDESSDVEVLERGLERGNAGQVIYCLDLLEESGHASLEIHLVKMLDHPDALVRRHVLEKIERLDLSDTLAPVTQRLGIEQAVEVRATLLRTICALSEAEGIERVVPFLDEPETAVRRGALVGLLRYCGIDGVLAGGSHLTGLLASANAAERALAAQVLGDIGINSFHRPLLTLLRDADLSVRFAAIEAARKLRPTAAITLLVEALNVPSLRGTASGALTEIGDAALPLLEASFAASDCSRPCRKAIAVTCGRIASVAAASFLRKHLAHPDGATRAQLLAAVVNCREALGNPEIPEARALILLEAEEGARAMVAWDDLRHDNSLAEVARAFLGEIKEIKQRIFLLLSLLHPPDVIRKARFDLEMNAGEKRAQALEVLDNLLALELKKKVFPLLDNLSPLERFKRLNALFPQPRLDRRARLEQTLLDSRTGAWAKSCALFAMGASRAPEWSPAAVAALSNPDELVRETAVWTLWRVNPEAFLQRASLLQDDRNPVIARLSRQLAQAENN